MSDLLDLRTVNETFNLGPCAEVRVGEHAIRYVRRGSGPCVVLLDADTEANPLWAPLVDALASGYRIIVPQPPPESVDTNTWLRGFVEGLGLSACVLIAGPFLFNAALDLPADDLTVRKLVLIANGHSPLGNSTPRVLWIEPDQSLEDSLTRILAFISGD